MENSRFSVFLFAQLDSTLDVPLEILNVLEPGNPAFLLAREQTRGRGSRGRPWWSAPRSHPSFRKRGATSFAQLGEDLEDLYPFTLLLLDFESFFLFQGSPDFWSLYFGWLLLRVCRSLCGSFPFFLKGPNDLYLETFQGFRKLGGILVERSSWAGYPLLKVGVGINGRVSPPLPLSSSLEAEMGCPHPVRFFEEFAWQFESDCCKDMEDFQRAWEPFLTWQLHHPPACLRSSETQSFFG